MQEYQKGAIYRQMQEYKREKIRLEIRLQEVLQKSVDHDDHIRVIDAWVLQVRRTNGVSGRTTADETQLLQEIELAVEGATSSPVSTGMIPDMSMRGRG